MQTPILFAHPDWTQMPSPPTECECAWINKQQLVVGLQRFGLDQPLRDRLPYPGAVREHYRNGFARDGLGLVECDVFDLDGVQAVRVIAKTIVQPTHAVYAGTIALPLPKESYVFNMACEEAGITGMRDTAIWVKISQALDEQGFEPEIPSEDTPEAENPAGMIWKHLKTGETVSWAQDPYEPSYNGPCLRNMADAPEYDAQFPEHPLSQLRVALRTFCETLKLSPKLKDQLHKKSSWKFW